MTIHRGNRVRDPQRFVFQSPDRIVEGVIFWTSSKDFEGSHKKVTMHFEDRDKEIVETDCDVLVLDGDGNMLDTIR